MRPIILRAGLAIAMVAAFLACRDDGVDPNATGNIVLQVVLGETEHPNAAGAAPDGTQPVAAVPGEALTHLDSAKATITGPTTQTITLTRGATNFTGSFSSIPVGTYTVVVAGYDLNAVDYYGRTTGVGVTAGQTATPTITFSSFVPGGTGQAFTGVPGTTTAFRLNAAFSIVANADSYRVELANNTGFNPVAAGAWLRQSPALVTVSGIGTWYLRVRAANAAAPSGGNWSANTQFQVVTDQRTSGDTPGSAPNLGFFATTTQTLDSLNISPATDVDWFSLNQCNGDEIIISAQALRLSPSSPLNPELRVYSTAGLLIAQNDDSGGTNTDGFVRLLHTYDNAYKVRVSGSGNTTGHYRLRLEGKAGANNATSSCRVVTLAVSNIAAGFLHACAVRSTGVTDCWGNNGNGQLGNGTTTISSSPVRVSGSQTLQTVTAGSFHSCGRTSGGAAYCWGSNAGGQLGDGTTMQRETPVPVSTTQSFVYLGAGDRFTCGLTGGGAAYCWGDNGAGQLGTGNNTNSNTPVPVTGSHTFVSLAVGQFHACGNRSDGAVYCWGGGGRGQLGNGVFSNSNTPVLVSGSGSTLVLQGVAANGDQTCARTNPGNAAYCWGRNASGQLGDGTFTDQAIPVAVAGGYVFAHLAPGRFHTCGYRTDGVPMCWGSNFDGQLGDGTTFLRSTPAVVSGGLVFQQMAGGAYHTCAWTSSNLAYCWGWNGFGQLGDAGAFNHTGPIPVSGTLALRSLSTNNQHTCGVTTSGSTHCWGWNNFGQLGDGSLTDRLTPVQITGNNQSISTGEYHSCAVTSGGVLTCWGRNFEGQVGDATNTDRLAPVTVSGAYQSVSVGGYHTCALSTSTAYCWGYNFDGELGIGTSGSGTNRNTPAAVTGTYQAVAAGFFHTCALRSSGGVIDCWGYNGLGQLGNGTTTSRNTPGAINSTLSFQSVVAGFVHTCALTTTGAAHCWGSNSSGQLGDGSFTQRITPVAVSGGLTFRSLSAGYFHTCGVTTSDVLYCWGEGFSGQQGTGSFSDRNTPGLVGGALAVQAVSAGGSQTCAYTTSSGSPYCWGNNERGQLGNGTRTIRVTPATVITGPASAPPILTAGYTEADWLRSEGRVGAAAEHRTGAPVKEVERPGRW